MTDIDPKDRSTWPTEADVGKKVFCRDGAIAIIIGFVQGMIKGTREGVDYEIEWCPSGRYSSACSHRRDLIRRHVEPEKMPEPWDMWVNVYPRGGKRPYESYNSACFARGEDGKIYRGTFTPIEEVK